MRAILFIALSSLLVFGVTCIYLGYQFDKNCSDWLKHAADASLVEKADMFIDKAVDYIEDNKLTQGNSGIFFEPPSDDVGVWYGQIKDAQKVTSDFLAKEKENPASATEQERSLTLMKIRQTLLDDSSGSTTVTEPTWISWYPNEVMMCIWFWLTIVLGVISAINIIRYGRL